MLELFLWEVYFKMISASQHLFEGLDLYANLVVVYVELLALGPSFYRGEY